MTRRKETVERYFDGFRRSDHELILSCLTDDVLWEIHGHTTLEGKEAFDAEIENEGFEGSPALTVDRLVEEGDVVVAIGTGSGTRSGGETFGFVFSDVFTFKGDAIARVESYLVMIG